MSISLSKTALELAWKPSPIIYIIQFMQMNDTSKDAQAFQLELLRKMPTEKKIQQIFSAYATGKALAMAGLRERYPQASEKRIWYLWAQQHLGASLSKEVYGELPLE